MKFIDVKDAFQRCSNFIAGGWSADDVIEEETGIKLSRLRERKPIKNYQTLPSRRSFKTQVVVGREQFQARVTDTAARKPVKKGAVGGKLVCIRWVDELGALFQNNLFRLRDEGGHVCAGFHLEISFATGQESFDVLFLCGDIVSNLGDDLRGCRRNCPCDCSRPRVGIHAIIPQRPHRGTFGNRAKRRSATCENNDVLHLQRGKQEILQFFLGCFGSRYDILFIGWVGACRNIRLQFLPCLRVRPEKHWFTNR